MPLFCAVESPLVFLCQHKLLLRYLPHEHPFQWPPLSRLTHSLMFCGTLPPTIKPVTSVVHACPPPFPPPIKYRSRRGNVRRRRYPSFVQSVSPDFGLKGVFFLMFWLWEGQRACLAISLPESLHVFLTFLSGPFFSSFSPFTPSRHYFFIHTAGLFY